MDRYKLLMVAGVLLGLVAALLLLAALFSAGEDEQDDDAAAVPPPRSVVPELVPPAADPDIDEPVLTKQTAPRPARRDEPVRREEPPTRRVEAVPSAPIMFCFPNVLPTADGCASRAAVLDLVGKRIGVRNDAGRTRPLTVNLVSPTTTGEGARRVESCDVFLELKSRGWGALTSADLSRELDMNRFCGLIVMARKAMPPTRDGGIDRLSSETLSRLPPGELPAIGEARPSGPVSSIQQEEALWTIEAESLVIRIREVSVADFDEDGLPEVLVYTTVRPGDGTARAGGYALIEREGATLSMTTPGLY